MSRAHSVGHDLFHLLNRRGHQNCITEGAAGQRIDEPEGENLRDLADLFLEVIGPNLNRPRDSARQLLVPSQEDPVFQSNPLDEGTIRTRFRICGVVPHEPEPSGETPEHVVAEELHNPTFESASTTARIAFRFVRRKRGFWKPGFQPSPPSSSQTTMRLATWRRR